MTSFGRTWAKAFMMMAKRRGFSDIEAMATLHERMERFDDHPVEVSERKHVDHAVAGMQEVEVIDAVADVAPNAAEREHHPFGGACRAGGVVDDGEIIRAVAIILHVAGREIVGKFFSEKQVEVFVCFP